MTSLFILYAFLAGTYPVQANDGKSHAAAPHAGAAPATVIDSKPAVPQDVPAAVPGADNPINKFAAALKDNPKETNPKAIEVLYAYLTDAENTYLSADAAKDDGPTRLKAMVQSWVETSGKDDAKRGGVANLYVAITDPSKTWRNQLSVNMKPWASQLPSDSGPGQLKGTEVAGWTTGFLDRASQEAGAVIAASHFTNEQWRQFVEKYDNPPDVSAGAGPAEKRPVLTGPIEGWDSLYQHGAEVKDLYQAGDNFARTIAIKLLTVKQADGTLKNEIRIYDLTDPTTGKPKASWDIFSQGFPVDGGGTSTFQLDDRTPGKKKYTLTMNYSPDGDMTIVFSRDGVQSKDPKQQKEGPMIETSLNKLAVLRAQQAVDEGAKVKIDGKDFYALGAAGGGFGKLCYYPAEIKKQIESGVADADALMPAALADITQTTAGGTKLLSKKPDLGQINGKPYHLEFVADKKYWQVMPGEGIKPKPEPKPEPEPKPKPKPGEPEKPGEAKGCDPDGAITTAGLYVRETESVKGLPEGLVCIFKATKKAEDTIIADPKNAKIAHQMYYQMTIPKYGKNYYVPFQPRSAKDQKYTLGKDPISTLKAGDKYYLVTKSDGGIVYLDLQNFEEDAEHNKSFSKGAWIVFDQANDIEGLNNKELLADAMEKAGFTPAETKTAQANLAKVLPADAPDYTIMGHKTASLNVNWTGNRSVQFWPKLVEGEKPDPNHGDTKDGNAYDKDIPSGPFQNFVDDPVVNEQTLTLIKKTETAALYHNGVPEDQATKEKPRRYYLIFGFVNHFGGDKKMRSKFLELFSKGNNDILAYPASGVDLDGLMKHSSPLDLLTASGINIRFLGEKAKGVYAGFATRAENPKDKKGNCLGPIVWWGMSREDAQASCEKGS